MLHISKIHKQHYNNENKEHKIGTIWLCLNKLGIISNANDLPFIHLCRFLFLNGFQAQKN